MKNVLSEREMAGVILAGGQSRRMGRNKALLDLNGESFLIHIATILSGIFPQNYISAVRNNYSDYLYTNLSMVIDHYENAGPLAGIHAALCTVSAPYIFVTSCDMPNITPNIIRFVISWAMRDKVLIAQVEERLCPLFGVYPKSILPSLDSFLQSGKRKVLDFLATLGPEQVTTIEISSDKDCLKNINTPADYDNLR